MKSVLVFLLQSIVAGLAVAFVVVLLRPDLLPDIASRSDGTVMSYADAVELSAPAVANIYTKRLVRDRSAAPNGRFRVDTSFGSGVIIDAEGYLVTNYHVVRDAAEVRVQLSDGRVLEPVTVGEDPETDLALLKVDAGPLPVIAMGRSANLRIGDVVLAIGNPYGLTKSVTQGIVSATGRGILNLATFENYIQTDAAINAGNSGGALVNARGELVGINTAVLAQDTGTEGIGFAIPVDLVRGVVEQIKLHGRVIRGWVGFEPHDLTDAERMAMGLEAESCSTACSPPAPPRQPTSRAAMSSWKSTARRSTRSARHACWSRRPSLATRSASSCGETANASKRPSSPATARTFPCRRDIPVPIFFAARMPLPRVARP